MTPEIVARHDPRLGARVVRRAALLYREGADPETGRPSFVRAGSSLARMAERYVVVQDDANFVALIEPRDRQADCIALPPDPEGNRLFDEAHGNRADKLDLEACLTATDSGEPLLLAFGSGSGPSRERIVRVRWRDGEPEASVHDGSALYAVLREANEFSGSELNVEGAVWLEPDRVRLFQRGNGEVRDGLDPVDATCDLSWPALLAFLRDPDGTPPPRPDNVVRYRLGELDGVRLTFSDADNVPGGVLYSASAEASGGGDGRIAGSVLGVIDADGARWATLLDEEGNPFGGKIEGLSVDPADPRLVFFVVDDDDAEQPSDIFEAELSGPWFRTSGPTGARRPPG